MAAIFQNIIVLALALIIIILVAAVIWLNIAFYHDKKKFNAELQTHRQMISDINKKQSAESDKVKLATDIDKSLNKANYTLFTKVFALNFELFEILSKNNFLKK